MALNDPASETNLLRLMSEVISLREQVAQAELRVQRLRQLAPKRVVSAKAPKKRARRHR